MFHKHRGRIFYFFFIYRARYLHVCMCLITVGQNLYDKNIQFVHPPPPPPIYITTIGDCDISHMLRDVHFLDEECTSLVEIIVWSDYQCYTSKVGKSLNLSCMVEKPTGFKPSRTSSKVDRTLLRVNSVNGRIVV